MNHVGASDHFLNWSAKASPQIAPEKDFVLRLKVDALYAITSCRLYYQSHQIDKDFGRLCQTLPDFARLCQTLKAIEDFARLCQTLKALEDFARLCQTLKDFERLWKTLEDFGRLWKTFKIQISNMRLITDSRKSCWPNKFLVYDKNFALLKSNRESSQITG